MIVNKYQGNGGGGGGSYVLPTATANRLGGIKVGSGVTITNDGTLSAEEATVIDLAVLSAMTSADRVAFWDEVYGKVSDGKSVFMKGLVYGEADRTAILPVVSFRPETSAVTHEGGNIFFGAKGDTDNIYFHINFGSDGSISPTDGMAKTFIAGKASAETLGLVKVGSGLTIDGSGVLSATGGGSGSGDYMVVSGLPATAQEGQLFFVPAHTENVLYRTYAFDCSGMHQNEVEGYVLPEGALNEKTLYYQWNNGDYGWFHWDWGENEHDWVEKEDWGWYKVGEGDYTFYAKVPDGSVDLSSVNEYVTVDSSVTETVQISVAPATYRYTGNAFRKEVVKIKINDFKGADYGFNSDNLFDYLQQFTEEELKQNFVFEHDGKYAKYAAYSESSEPEYSNYTFEVGASSVSYPIGTPTISPKYSLNVYPDGHIDTDGQNEISIFLPIRMSLNVFDSGLTCQNSGALWVRSTDYTWGGSPFVVVIYDSEAGNVLGYTQNCWFRQAYDGDNSDWADLSSDGTKIFGCEWYQYGDKITAEWVVNSEGGVVGGAPINWNVTSNVHSAADSTIPTNS